MSEAGGQPIRVLHFFSSSGMGGTELNSAKAVAGIDKGRFEQYGLFYGAPGEALPLFEGHLERQYAPGPSGFLAFLRLVIRVAGEVRPDVVLVYGFTANMFWRLGRVLSSACRRPVYVLVLRSLHPIAKPTAKKEKLDLLFSGMHQMVFSNSKIAADFLEQRGYPKRPVVLTYNGLDVSAFHPDEGKEETRAVLGIPADVRVAVCVALFRREKGHQRLLDAFAKVAARMPEARLLLVGDGELRQVLMEQCGALGIVEKVHFVGKQQDVAKWLQASDVFVLFSDFEGFPNAVLEGMAAGLPVVCTKVGGIPELVRDGEDGALVPLGDEAAAVEALVSLLGDPVRARAVGQAGRRRVEERFSMEQMVRSWEQGLVDAARILRR